MTKKILEKNPSRRNTFQTCIWNGETSEFLGRTAASWGKILLFYAVFYTVLAGFSAGLFTVFWRTLDMEQPKWKLHEGMIGTNPGLAYRPMSRDAKLGGTLIWYDSKHPNNITYWYDVLGNFLQDYINPTNMENVDESCNMGRSAAEGKFCPFKIESLGNCSPEKTDNKYGFPQKRPCVFLKLNKILNWNPRVFNETSVDELRNDEERKTYQKMPKSVKDAIANSSTPLERNMIWVSCDGEKSADVDNIGLIKYSPRPGFPAYFYPYKNVKGYQPPIIAVQFEQPKVGVLINIECKVWAKNIIYDRAERRGSVRFGLMID